MRAHAHNQTYNPTNTHAHKHYYYSLAVTFITSYAMTVSSVRSLGQKNIMQFISFGREHPVAFKIKYENEIKYVLSVCHNYLFIIVLFQMLATCVGLTGTSSGQYL